MSQFVNTASVKKMYETAGARIADIKKQLNRPLTFVEKILYTHLADTHQDTAKIVRGESILALKPDRVCMQDATAQMAILQFASIGIDSVVTPTSVHCDHLIQAQKGAHEDLLLALNANEEVYKFLSSSSKKYGMDFWKPGSGIIHQIFLENYAFPGGLVVGTDSHTPTAGGLAMVAIGVGGSDAVDVMADEPWQIRAPKIYGIHLKRELNGWTSSKDVILYLCGLLTAEGGTGIIFEYFGKGCKSISATGKSTITNMGAELGATTSVFPYDERMSTFLRATGRADAADSADEYASSLVADKEVEENPKQYFDRVIEIDLNSLEPALNGPDTPDARHALSQLKEDFKAMNLPEEISVCLIGSCTNSSYEDMYRASAVAKDAHEKGLTLKSQLMISPGSNQIAETMKRDGFTQIFEQIGGLILSNSCGPCIGQWKRDNLKEGEKNVIVNSFNRNFKKRNDGRTETYAFVTSPEMVVAMAFGGKLTFNPFEDVLVNDRGEKVKLSAPKPAPDVPALGFAPTDLAYEPPAQNGKSMSVEIDPKSERLQLLEPFEPWNLSNDFINLAILVKAKGKCTTDHISPAGKWLAYRGHLENISKNVFSGVTNAFYPDAVGKGKNSITGAIQDLNEIAGQYKNKKIGWIAVGDENYGEGSSREHAAMEPRFLGCRLVIAKSFARIAETNLKKQGLLPLRFQNPDDYKKLLEDDRIALLGVEHLVPGKPVALQLTHRDASKETIFTEHSLTEEEIQWIYAGSSLNKIGAKLRKRLKSS